MNYYIADFETTVPDFEDDSIDEINTRVWSWGVCELNKPETFLYGTKIETFIDWCSKHNGTVYFHNLKFDGKFLIDFLLRNQFTYDPDRKTDNSFSTLISEFGQFYSIDITFKVYQKRRLNTIFYDSSKKIPLSVSQISESFNLDIKKGSIDYKKERPVGYLPDREELEYLKNDVGILAKALHIQHEKGLKRMTVGGDALSHYKSMVGDNFKKWFPDILDEKCMMFKYFKMFYRGGYVYVNPKYEGKDIGEGVTYDENSVYPYVLKEKLLPYGQPIRFTGKYDESMKEIYPLYCQSILAEFKLKEDHIPFVHDKSGFYHRMEEYIVETKPCKAVGLHLTNVEMELFFEHYDVISIQYDGGFMFKGRTGMFDQYVDHWNDIKMQATKDGNKGLRQISKLMLNSLYGKFGKNVVIGGKFPKMDDKKDKVIYIDQEKEIKKGVYIPVALFVTSYARDMLIRSAQECYDRFIYCDTDSLHLKGLEEPKTLRIDPVELGAWKYEGAFKRARFLRPKAYIHDYGMNRKEVKPKVFLMRRKLDVKCSGMTDDIKKKVSFNSFHFGFSAYGKKTPKTVNGGVVLVDTTYTLLQ